MRFNLRLRGRTADGLACQAEVAVFARSLNQLQDEANKASLTADWRLTATGQPVPQGTPITVEHVDKVK